MNKHSAPEKPEPLPRKDTTIILWVTAFLVLLVLLGWGISIKQVLIDGYMGAQEGVEALVESGEEIKEATALSREEISGSAKDISSTFTTSLEEMKETQGVVEEIAAAIPEVIESRKEEELQIEKESEEVTVNDVLELTQEKLQAE
jgi:hypothetical protein